MAFVLLILGVIREYESGSPLYDYSFVALLIYEKANNGENRMEVQAAAISLQGNNFVVVLVGMEMVTQSGEADMMIDTLQPKFDNVPVILMAQREDTSPVYYGDQDLVTMLRDIAVDDMPWKSYPV